VMSALLATIMLIKMGNCFNLFTFKILW